MSGRPELAGQFRPVAKILDCEYTDRGTIRYEHDGYVGAWVEEETTLAIHEALVDFIKTDEYKNHRYFGTRQNQMEQMMEFLPVCGGFRAC